MGQRTARHQVGTFQIGLQYGILQIAPIEQTDESLWDAILETNLKGAYLVTRSALPHLRESRGDIVNISSTAGRQAFAGSSAYCASKWGLMGLTNVLREELRDTGIRVMTVVPGAVDTGIWDDIPDAGVDRSGHNGHDTNAGVS